MTKKARIIALHRQGKTTRQIAQAIYGKNLDAKTLRVKTSYVRTVTQQRRGAASSDYDRNWLLNRFGGKTVAEALRNRWRTDAAYRARHNRGVAAYRQRQRSAEDATHVV